MGLNVIVDSLESIEEDLRALYVAAGDKFILDVDDIDQHPGVTNLSKTMKEERDARKKNDKALKELQAATKGLDLQKLKNIDPEKYKSALIKLEKVKDAEKKLSIKKLKDKEEWEKLEKQLLDENTEKISAINRQHNKKIATIEKSLEEIKTASQAKIDKMLSSLETHIKDKEIIAALATAKGNIPVLMPHISKHVKVMEDEAGKFSARVIDNDGDVRINKEGSPMKISEFVDELREKKEFQGEGLFEKDKQSGGSGSHGNQSTDQDNKNNPFSKEHFNLTEIGKLKKSDPAKYERLKRQAGKG